MIIARYFVVFFVFSVIGWLFECCFCTIKSGHWENRGFLYGPLCPIYGVGVAGAMLLFQDLPNLLDGSMELSIPAIFLGSLLGSAVLEFGTSWVLEKIFHAVWWDYSHIPLNIQGRICLPVSCCFGIAGVILVKLVFPLVDQVPVPDSPLLFELLSLLFAAYLGADLALTVESLTRLTRRLDEAQEHFDMRMETGVQTVRQGPAAVGSAVKASAQDAGETVAIAAMLAADAAKGKLDTAKEKAEASGRIPHVPRPQQEKGESAEQLQRLQENLSHLDRYHVRSIRVYRPRKKEGDSTSAERIRRFFEELQRKAGRPEDRRKKKK